MLRSKKRQNSSESEGQNRDRWLLSYADLVTLLLALFIVMYAASDHERAKAIADSFSAVNSGGDGILPGNASPDEKTDKFEEKLLGNPALTGRTKMQQTSRGFIVSLSEAGFFAPGDAVINREVEEVINSIAENVMDSKVNIRVEGHTDSTPISNSRYPSNWELSTERASSVLLR